MRYGFLMGIPRDLNGFSYKTFLAFPFSSLLPPLRILYNFSAVSEDDALSPPQSVVSSLCSEALI